MADSGADERDKILARPFKIQDDCAKCPIYLGFRLPVSGFHWNKESCGGKAKSLIAESDNLSAIRSLRRSAGEYES